MSDDAYEAGENDIAVIGLSGRFPGARDVHAFWQALSEGRELVSQFGEDELEPSPLVPEALCRHPDFVRAAGVLEDAEAFDHDFFGLSPREARWMDPQQRVFLECAHAALEDAALDPERFAGKVALYAGAGNSGHALSVLAHAGRDPASLFEALGTTTAENVATKTSFKLRLRGESLAVYTACSTGLVAVHMACQSLLLRQSDVALAGAVKIGLPQRAGYLFQEGMIFSPDGHCRAFDARARGTVTGNGVGVVVLKLLSEALRDGDHVYAVVKGSAINNDGHQKVGYTAPSVEGQAAVISEALAYAGVRADEIDFVEAHGTGTPLGDPIEVAALTRAYRQDTERTGYCALGSVKTNVGHLDTAAGIAGFIKTVLALHHEELPETLHFERPNPSLQLERSPFFVNAERRQWRRNGRSRRAGVSSFGIGGTNAHAILEEAPPASPSERSIRSHQLVTLSARTPQALEAMAAGLAEHVETHPELELADVAFTRNLGRRGFEHRRAFVVGNRDALVRELRRPRPVTAGIELDAARTRPVALLFPGQGAQSAGMGRELYATEPGFREAFDEAAAFARPLLGRELREVLYPAAPSDAAEELTDPRLGLPALFAVEYALGRLWMDAGVEPYALFGHSYGEYAAACLAGVFSLEDGVKLAVARGALMARMPPGRMLAVGLAEEELRPFLTGGLSLAAVNGPSRTVVAGPVVELEALERELSRRDVGTLALPARHAFHSADVEPLMPELREAFARVTLNPPRRRLVSSVTGTFARDEEVTSPDYWANQMRQPVRFGGGVEALVAAGCTTVIETGPDQALSSLARLQFGRGTGQAVPSMPRAGSRGSDAEAFWRAVGQLWETGLPIAWDRLYAHERRARVSLPTYPFERKDCRLEVKWPELGAPVEATAGVARGDEVRVDSAQREREVAPTQGEREVLPVHRERGAQSERSEIERAVTGIWRERLGRSEIGLHDNFLELGGNSLMAAQMLTRLREQFSVQLPLSDLFESPTVAGISARIEAHLKAQQPGANRAPPVPFERIPRDAPLPFSIVQERVWWLEKLHPGNAALNMPLALRLSGDLRVDVLRRSLDEVVRRHEALRTVYPAGDSPRLEVRPALSLELPIVEVSGEDEALALARDEAARPFALFDEPVVRAKLLRLAPTEHVLLVTVHHVVSDTWSMVAIARELASLYSAFAGGQPSPLPELPFQYADYARWQRRSLDSGAFADQESFWRERLKALPGPLPLPTDRPRSTAPSLQATRRFFRLPKRLAEAVNTFSQREGATPFMVLLAGFQALLARYSGQTDVVVGTPIGNRTRGELEPLIGYVAHAIPLRTDLSGEPDFREAVARVREVTLAAYANPDVPYEHLVHEIEPEKDPRRGRLFDALFVLHGGFNSNLELPGLKLALVELSDAPAQFGSTLSDLSISMGEGPDGFAGTLEYSSALFEPATIDRLLTHWEALLTGALAQPTLRLSALPLLGDEERRALTARLETHRSGAGLASLTTTSRAAPSRGLDFSLSYFANDEDALGANKYRLLVEGARFADTHGFSAVWTPERHFHSFGGLYPSPALAAAALATITRRVQLRAGSVVLPLHDPLEVAEQWSVVDNLSGGRVGVSFASGWHANDFVFRPDRYAGRKELMLREIETVRALWRGAELERTDGTGKPTRVGIRPRPVQPELPWWLTAAGSPDTFRLAGELGASVLTNLMGQKLDALASKVALYREAWRKAGHPGRGHVSLMLHAFLGDHVEQARATVREPLLRYFRSSVDIFRTFAATQGLAVKVEDLTERDIAALTEHGLERYVEDGGLFGTPETAAPVVERVRGLGVDEVACLIDFGVPAEAALAGLEALDRLRASYAPSEVTAAPGTTIEVWDRTGPSPLERARAIRAGEEFGSAASSSGAEGSRFDRLSSNGEWLVVDARFQPVPIGVVGELVVAGADIGRGIEPDPELERELLAPHPLRPGALVFRTGRRARLLSTGEWRFVEQPSARRGSEIVRVDRARPLPLSFAQQRLWYMDQLEPGNPAYNNPVALRMVGKLDRGALERSLQEVVRRHEILRTTFAVEASGPVQRIADGLELSLSLLELDAPEHDRDARLLALAREEAARPFDLSRGPLIRATLVRVHGDEHVLLLNLHHIVSDGWSAGVLSQELAALYAAFASGSDRSPLPPLSVQYADYAQWQREWMQGPQLERELTWWKVALDELPVLELPIDRPRPAVQTYGGARLPVKLSRETSDALAAIGRRVGATPFMVLLAAYEALLSRYSGQTDFAVGTPVAGRNRPEVEPLVGCFVNTLALRADLSGDPTFVELVQRVRANSVAAFAHQEVPFEKLVDALHVPRELSHTPLVQTMLVLHNTPAPSVQLAGLALSGLEVHSGATKLDLTLELRESPNGLEGGLEYNTDLFDDETAAQLARDFVRLVEGALRSPEERVSTLPLLSAEERSASLSSEAASAAREFVPVHVRFEEQAARAPAAPAILLDETSVTYGALNARANRIAHVLRARGVRPDDCVLVALERPVEVIAAILGVLKAGGAYVPIDPLHPEERLHRILAQVQPRAVLTERWLEGRFGGQPVIAVDALPDASDENPAPIAGPADAAYVLFTSGSTGEPKGVVVEHRNLTHSTDARLESYPSMTAGLVLSPFTFDAATGGIFWALTQGAALCYPGEATRDDPSRLAAFVAERHVTHVMGVPALWAQLLSAAPPGALSSLKAVVVGGERCPPELVGSHSQALPEVPLFNEYGPTEATVWATFHRAEPRPGPVPIGRAIPGVQTFVLDAQLQPVPLGAPGELFLGGAGIARGYLGRPELTAERFIESPFAPGERLYRTGDRVRRRRDGALEFLGRLDGQVKVRGFRIELGEIEAALGAHPAVREVAVIAAPLTQSLAKRAPGVPSDAVGGARRLVAYLVARDGEAVDADVLRAHLRSRLPEYMVPSAFVTMEALPRTRHGKLDRRALPSPERTTSTSPEAAPRTEQEMQLAAIWREVLNLPSVGIHDNFFELGGDSILSIQIVTRAARVGVDVTPKQLFQNPTIAQLAAVANTRLQLHADQGPVTGPVALTPVQRWFFEQPLTNPAHWNMSLRLEVGQPLDVAALQRALDAVATHHDALRLRLAHGPGGWAQACVPEVSVPLAVQTVDGDPELDAQTGSLQRSLDLAHGPLFRAALFQPKHGGPLTLVLIAHHLVVDGVSWRVLLEDLAVAYRRALAGEAIVLPPKTTSYQAWAAKLLEEARSERALAERSWWSGRAWTRARPLPKDRHDGRVDEQAAHTLEAELGADETKALLQDVARAYHANVAEALLTALAQALAGWTGADAARVDVEVHGREALFDDVDLSRTVGWFTALYPALLELPSGDPGVALKAVKEQLRRVPRNGVGFGVLRHLSPDAEVRAALAAIPPAEVSFNYLGQLDPEAANGPWRISPRPPAALRAPDNRRPYLLDVGAVVLAGRLRLTLVYDEGTHRADTAAGLLADFVLRVRQLIEHCRSPEAGGHTPSDFPLARVDQAKLDRLAAKFGKKTR